MSFDELFDKIQAGDVSKKEAKKLVSLSYINTTKQLTIDNNRSIRNNTPEIIYGEYKTLDQISELVEETMLHNKNVIVSLYKNNEEINNHFSNKYKVTFNERVLIVGDIPKAENNVLVISGGASDHPIASEVCLALKAFGSNPILFEDRGIAHPTRVLDAISEGLNKDIKTAVVIAGMEASLATYVSSLLPIPIIGVPTSVGYGYKSDEAALISMLSSCTPNLAVVNINGGIRAAVISHLITNPTNINK